MNEGCQQIILALFGESWPPSAKPRRIVNPLRQHKSPGSNTLQKGVTVS